MINKMQVGVIVDYGKKLSKNQRANYGKQIITTLSLELTTKYGRNFEEKNLRRMLQFAKQFNDEKIVVTLSRQLSWSHMLIAQERIEKSMLY